MPAEKSDPTPRKALIASDYRVGEGLRPGNSGVVDLTDLGPLLQKLWQILRAYGWEGILVALAIFATAFAYARSRVPDYTAQVTLLAESSVAKIINPSEGPQIHPDFYENILRNLLSGMESRSFQQYLVSELPPEEARSFQQSYLSPEQNPSPVFLRDLIEQLIKVERDRGRELYTVAVKHRDPQVAVTMANRFARTYLQYLRAEFRRSSLTATDAMKQTAAELTAEIDMLENQRREFRRTNRLISSEGNQTMFAERIKRLDAALAEAHLVTAKQQEQLEQAKRDLQVDPLSYNNSLLAGYADSADLRVKFEAASAARAVLAERYGPNYPRMIESARLLEKLRQSQVNNFQLALRELESRYQSAVATEKRLRADLDAAFADTLDLDRLSVRLTAGGNQIAAKRAALSDLMQRLERAHVESELPKDVMQLGDAAFLRRTLLSPRIGILAAGTILAGISGLLIPILLAASNRRISADEDLERVLGREVFGVVPMLKRIPEASRGAVVRKNLRLEYTESFMTIAGQLCLRATAGRPFRLIVTSTIPGEGKSMVTSNVAAALARLGRRTVIIDLDLRRAVQQQFVGRDVTGGVLPLLKSSRDLSEISTKAIEGLYQVDERLYLLPAGGEDLQPAQWLMSPGLGQLIDLLSKEFDMVLIDTPPVGILQDATLCATFADASLLVVRHGFALKSHVVKAVQDLSTTAAPVIGLVGNGFLPRHANSALGYRQIPNKYGKYYGLHTSDALNSPITAAKAL